MYTKRKFVLVLQPKKKNLQLTIIFKSKNRAFTFKKWVCKLLNK